MTDGFMLMYKDLPGLQVVVHSIPSFPLLRSLSTLCYFPMVWHGLPPHPMKPKCAASGQLRLGPKLCTYYTNATICTYQLATGVAPRRPRRRASYGNPKHG